MNDNPTLRIPQELHELRMRVMKEEVDEYAEEYAITGGTEDGRLQAVAKELADPIHYSERLSHMAYRMNLNVFLMQSMKII